MRLIQLMMMIVRLRLARWSIRVSLFFAKLYSRLDPKQ
jgi:hypothetical protein